MLVSHGGIIKIVRKTNNRKPKKIRTAHGDGRYRGVEVRTWNKVAVGRGVAYGDGQ